MIMPLLLELVLEHRLSLRVASLRLESSLAPPAQHL